MLKFFQFTLLFLAAISGSAAAADGARSCISTNRIDRTEIVDGQTILFHMVGKKTYINKLRRRCPGLSFHKAFSYRVSLNRLCKTDIIRVYQGDYFGAACGLSKFEPYVEVEQDQKLAEESNT